MYVHVSLTRPSPSGEHGSTFGGNPLGCKVAMTAMDVLETEGLYDNALKMGDLLMGELNKLPKEVVELVRGRGLFCGVVIRYTVTCRSDEIR